MLKIWLTVSTQASRLLSTYSSHLWHCRAVSRPVESLLDWQDALWLHLSIPWMGPDLHAIGRNYLTVVLDSWETFVTAGWLPLSMSFRFSEFSLLDTIQNCEPFKHFQPTASLSTYAYLSPVLRLIPPSSHTVFCSWLMWFVAVLEATSWPYSARFFWFGQGLSCPVLSIPPLGLLVKSAERFN
jgi:hypothetical protein